MHLVQPGPLFLIKCTLYLEMPWSHISFYGVGGTYSIAEFVRGMQICHCLSSVILFLFITSS